MSHNYTAEQIGHLQDIHLNHVRCAEAIGVSEAAVRRWRRANGIVVVAPSPRGAALVGAKAPKALPGDEVTREELLEAELRDLRRAAARDRKSDVAQERVLRAIEEAAGEIRPIRPEPSPKPAAISDEAHHRQVAIWSDWHCGEMVSYEEMGGLNSFDFKVLQRRVADTVAALLSFKRVRPEMTGLELWILGDMCSGAIHGLEESNEFPLAVQAIKAGQLMAWGIAELAPHYPEINVVGIVGNHPRSKTAPVSKTSYDSGDFVAYELARALTSELENVHWEIPLGGFHVAEVAGQSVLLFHGDGVKSSMPGVPWGGIARRTNELVKTYLARDIELDAFACGHFHQINVIGSRLFMNGSLVGQNEYGLKFFGGGEGAKQLVLCYDEKRGRLTDASFITVA